MTALTGSIFSLGTDANLSIDGKRLAVTGTFQATYMAIFCKPTRTTPSLQQTALIMYAKPSS